MKLNHYKAKIFYFPSGGSLLTDDCSGAFFREITRAALLTIVLGITVVLATSCASTRNAVSTRLIRAVGNNQQATNSKNDSWYQPTRGPGFDPDLFGG
jgi:hypothetical protein